VYKGQAQRIGVPGAGGPPVSINVRNKYNHPAAARRAGDNLFNLNSSF